MNQDEWERDCRAVRRSIKRATGCTVSLIICEILFIIFLGLALGYFIVYALTHWLKW